MFAKLVIASLIGLSSLSLASVAEAAPPARTQVRQAHQQARIADGVAHGSLSAREAAHLEREQAHIDRMQHRMRADDGRIGPRERARLERAQNRSSRHIARLKHD
ncbi:MAG: hypothetical protein U1F43_19485 [Myxococcota bacterium]